MRRLILVLATAQAAVAAPARTCTPAGGVLFEIAQRAVKGVRLVTATTWLYGNGAWHTEVIDLDGKVARTAAGCLEMSQLDEIRNELARARWKITKTAKRCRADQPRFTRYIWKSHLVYTERTCNVDVLDHDSREALDVISMSLHAPQDLDGAGMRRECLDNPLAPGCD